MASRKNANIRSTDVYERAQDLLEKGDTVNGMKLVRQAAEDDHFAAMHHLALLLRQKNTKESFEEAAIWYRRAAEWKGFGFAGAQNNLGDMYETGEGLPKSAGDAIYWYTRSAMQGEPTAYLSLGSCFAEGVGVMKDLKESYFWFLLASRHLGPGSNRDSATKQLAAIEKSLTPKELSESKAKADQFVPYFQTGFPIGDPLERDESADENKAGDAKK